MFRLHTVLLPEWAGQAQGLPRFQASALLQHAQGSRSDLPKSTPASLACMIAPAVSGLSPETRPTRHSCGCLSVGQVQRDEEVSGSGTTQRPRLWASGQIDPSEMGQPCWDTPCSLDLSQHADWRAQQLAISQSAMRSVEVRVTLRSSPPESPACPLLTFTGHCSPWGTKCPSWARVLTKPRTGKPQSRLL